MKLFKCFLISTFVLLGFSCQKQIVQNSPSQKAVKTAQTPKPSKIVIPKGKLFRDVLPTEYFISLEIDPRKDSFSGKVAIDLQIKKPTNHFFIHGKALRVKSSKLKTEKEELKVQYKQVSDDGIVQITIPKTLNVKNATLFIEYEADYNKVLNGLYKISDKNKPYIFSQMEAIFFRQAIPGFDEPSFKTPYNIKLKVRNEDVAITNSLQESETKLKNGFKELSFAKTPPLPTYLLAFAVGDLDVVIGPEIPANKFRKKPLRLRGVAAKGKGGKLKYALKHTGDLLLIQEKYFASAYPYDKLDIIAVPDFASGAMENAGAITFRETLLLFDEKTAPIWQKKSFANVMAHELAHMWFGNITTMPWWDDIWLNEAFATWMAFKTVKIWKPEYRPTLDLLSRAHWVMGIDSKKSARQIRQSIDTNHDIQNAFDGITYTKGAQVLSMFESYVGEENFRKSIAKHIENFYFKNADYNDFLKSLNQYSGKKISKSFKTFLFQPGIPYLDIKLSCKKNLPSKVTVTQKRFLPLGSAADENKTWILPFCFRYQIGQKNHQSCQMISQKSQEFSLSEKSCPKWFLPNLNGAAYYRWSLPLKDIEKLLKNKKLTVSEKMAVKDSLISGFENGGLKINTLFNSFKYLAKSKERKIASAPMPILRFSKDRLLPEKLRTKLQKFSRNLYAKKIRKFDFKNSSKLTQEEKLFQNTLLSFLTDLAKDKKLRIKAKKLAYKYVGYHKNGEINPKALDPNLVSLVLKVAVEDSDEKFFNFLLKTLHESNDARIRSNIISALAQTKDKKLSNTLLKLTVDAKIKLNEIPLLLFSRARKSENRETLWPWLKQNYDSVIKNLSDKRAGYLPYLTSGFCKTEKAKEVNEFFEERIKKVLGGPRNLKSALESIELCSKKVAFHREDAINFFKAKK